MVVMNRIATIFFPLFILLVGVILCFLVKFIFSLPSLNILKSLGIGLLLGVIEVQFLRKIEEDKLKYILLDGAIFPFFSMGIAAGFLL